MEPNERRIIDDLFDRLREAEARSDARDPDADALIRDHVAAQPAAPYYMAQAIVVQQEALARGQTRIQDLERQLAERRSGGFFSGLFGGDEGPSPSPAAASRGERSPGDFGRYQQAGAGGGFLAGAMQTALGVAGGFLIADAISGMLSADGAAAGAPEAGRRTILRLPRGSGWAARTRARGRKQPAATSTSTNSSFDNLEAANLRPTLLPPTPSSQNIAGRPTMPPGSRYQSVQDQTR